MDRKSVKLLKQLRNGWLCKDYVDEVYGESFASALVEKKMVKHLLVPNPMPGEMPIWTGYEINVGGKDFLADKKESSLRFWLPVSISILALIIAGISLYFSLRR